MARKKPDKSANISVNRRARHEYKIDETVDAGMALEGWEVKSLRAGQVSLAEAYVYVRNGEIWLQGATITPLLSASSHVKPEPGRHRKLLMNRREIDRLASAADRDGYTLVPLRLHWLRGRAKLDVGVGKGKKAYDKRATERERDWNRDKHRILKSDSR